MIPIIWLFFTGDFNMLAEARNLLKKTYLPAYEKLASSLNWQRFAEEKYIHSFQVLL